MSWWYGFCTLRSPPWVPRRILRQWLRQWLRPPPSRPPLGKCTPDTRTLGTLGIRGALDPGCCPRLLGWWATVSWAACSTGCLSRWTVSYWPCWGRSWGTNDSHPTWLSRNGLQMLRVARQGVARSGGWVARQWIQAVQLPSFHSPSWWWRPQL